MLSHSHHQKTLVKVFLSLPIFVLRVPLPLQRPIQQPRLDHLVALHTALHGVLLSPLRAPVDRATGAPAALPLQQRVPAGAAADPAAVADRPGGADFPAAAAADHSAAGRKVRAALQLGLAAERHDADERHRYKPGGHVDVKPHSVDRNVRAAVDAEPDEPDVVGERLDAFGADTACAGRRRRYRHRARFGGDTDGGVGAATSTRFARRARVAPVQGIATFGQKSDRFGFLCNFYHW